jgi:hypothetical protein
MSGELAGAIKGATPHIAPWGAHALKVTEPEAFNSLPLDFRDHLQGVHGQDCRPVSNL